MLIDVNDTCAFGAVTLGQTDRFGAEMYFTGIDGWGAPQSTVQAIPKAYGDGGYASPAFLQPRTFTVSGAIVAPDRPSLVAAFDRVQAAASIGSQPVTVLNGGALRFVYAQRQGQIIPAEQSDTALEFSIQFLAVDPRKFAASLTVAARLPVSVGGWTFPFTFPLTIGSTVVSGGCSLISPGSITGPVVLRIDGPVNGPIVTHTGASGTQVFATNYNLVAGNWLTIDMDAHTMLENDQAERSMYITSRGWSGVDAGMNTWSFTSAAYNPAALLTVQASPAWP
jgi:hypothetical protein